MSASLLLSLAQKKVYQYYIITYSMSQVKFLCTISPDSLLREAHDTTKLGHNIKVAGRLGGGAGAF